MSADLTSYRLDQAEQRAEKADARIARVEETVNDIKSIVARLPTKGDLLSYTLVSLAIGLAIMGLVIGGVIGGLDWIKLH